MTSTAYDPKSKCDRCGADSKDLYVVEAGEFLCGKCAGAKVKEAKEKLEYVSHPEDIDYINDPVAIAIFGLTERIEVTNELLLRLIKKVENVL